MIQLLNKINGDSLLYIGAILIACVVIGAIIYLIGVKFYYKPKTKKKQFPISKSLYIFPHDFED